MGMLLKCKTALKALLKLSQKTPTALPSFIQAVVLLLKAMRLVKHDLPLGNLCCLLLVAFLSSMGVEMASRMRHYISFLRIEVRLTSLKTRVVFAFFQSSGTFSEHRNLSKIIASSLIRMSISFLRASSCNQCSHSIQEWAHITSFVFLLLLV